MDLFEKFIAEIGSYVNNQNCRIWSNDSPQASIDTPLHLDKASVWRTYESVSIRPQVFKNGDGEDVIVNSEHYRNMLTNFFVPQLEVINIADLWFYRVAPHSVQYNWFVEENF